MHELMEPGVHPATFWILCGLAVLIQGIGKSGFAGGLALLTQPLMLAVMPVDRVAATLLPLLVLCDVNAVWHYRRDFDRPTVVRVSLASLPGIVLGAWIWWWIGESGIARHERSLEMLVGAVAFVFALYVLARERAFEWAVRHRPAPWTAVPTGIVAGLVSTLVHAAGPIVSLHVFALNLGKTRFVGTVAWIFLFINSAKVPFYGGVGLFDANVLRFDLAMMGLIPVGSWIGRRMHDRVPERGFNRIVCALTLMAGVKLIAG